MCRFYWGKRNVSFLLGQVDVTGLNQEVSGHFVDVLDKLRRILKHTGTPAVVDSAGNIIDGFCLQLLYQGLEARIRNSRRNPNLKVTR